MSGNSKNFLPPYHAIIAGDMSLASLTSPTTTISYLDDIAVQLNFSGSPTGTFAINGSIDQVFWIPITLSPAPAASGSAGQILLNLDSLSFPYLQVVYTKSSGTGSLDVWISGKSI